MYIEQFVGRLRYRGVLDFATAYKQVFAWFEENQFVAFEENFVQKPPYEFIVIVRGERKITSYVKYSVRVEFASMNFKMIETEKDGKRKRMFSGSLKISYFANVETDYEKDEHGNRQWESSPMLARLKHFFENNIFNLRFLFKHPDTIFYMVLALMENMKRTLSMNGVVQSYERLQKVEEEQNG